MKRCERCERNRDERFYSGPRGRICLSCQKRSRSDATHRARVGKTYGLLPGEYDTLFSAQGGVCAICLGARKQRLSVDHDHKTGLVRGLACRMCNGRLLTAARDRPEVLRAAAEYLENPPALRVLGERYASEEANTNTRRRRKR
ncbi:endonuclease VII domain-containing protein [Streptosporangium sp. NPDC002524]|uniref:endonuclease VII domain-containing protein n=1 Tax=Streptosporangium sp. NPDC002524 TaxID=3154537 RepID=UPI00331C1BE2